MIFTLATKNYYLLAKYAVPLISMMLGVLLSLLFADWQDTSPCLILTRHPVGVVIVRINQRCLRGCKTIDMCRITFTIIFNLHGGHKVKPLFMGYGIIVLVFIIKLILHGCRESILSGNGNYIFSEFFVVGISTFLLKLPALHQSWRSVIGQVVHLVGALSIPKNADPERFQNVIMNNI